VLRNFSTTAVIFYRVDGVAPTVSGDDTYRLNPEETLQVNLPRDAAPPQVGLISSGTPAYDGDLLMSVLSRINRAGEAMRWR
jgi:hypothetical protein